MKRVGGRGRCSVCDHDEHEAIDKALVRQVPLSKLEATYGVTGTSLRRHRKAHVSPSLTVVRQARAVKAVTTVVDELEQLIAIGRAFLTAAKRSKNAGQAMTAIREMRGTLELLARVTGELDDRPQVNVNIATSPDWIKTRTALLEALIPFPEATRAAADALAKVAAA